MVNKQNLKKMVKLEIKEETMEKEKEKNIVIEERERYEQLDNKIRKIISKKSLSNRNNENNENE